MASAVIVKSDDGKTNLVQETWEAFSSGGTDEPALAEEEVTFINVHFEDVRAGAGGGGRAHAAADTGEIEPREKALSAAQVDRMLDDPPDWKLLINTGADKQVLDKVYFGAAWRRSKGRGAITVHTRFPQPDEERVLAADENPGALKQLADMRGTPAALIGIIATLGGIYAVADKVTNPKFLTLAVGLAGAALVVSTWAALRLGVHRVRWSRLDELERRRHRRVQLEAARLKIPLLLAMAAVASYVLAMTTSGGPPSAASAKIANPSVATTTDGLKAVVTVDWSDLGEKVHHVATTVAGGRQVVAQNQATDDGAAKQELEVELGGAGDIMVTTRAIDAAGKPVGMGYIQTFTVAKPGGP